MTYYCSQLEGEQSKHVQKTPKALGWRFGLMQRYRCNGWLHITVPKFAPNDSRQRIRIRITHDHAHPAPPNKFEVRDGRGRFVPGNKAIEEPYLNPSRTGTATSAESSTQDIGLRRPAPTRAQPAPSPNTESRVPLPPSNPPSIDASPDNYADVPLPEPTYADEVLPSLLAHDSKSLGNVPSRPSPVRDHSNSN